MKHKHLNHTEKEILLELKRLQPEQLKLIVIVDEEEDMMIEQGKT